MSFTQNIRAAQKKVWPQVQESLDIRRAQKQAVEDDPVNATPAAVSRAKMPWTRVVADETVWAIGKSDLLATPEQAAVVKAARKWVESWQGDMPKTSDGYEPEDVELYRAVQALVSDLSGLDEME